MNFSDLVKEYFWKGILDLDDLVNITFKNLCVQFVVGVSYTSPPVQKNYIPVVMPPPNHTSPPSTAATFLATRLMAVLQPSGYSVFYNGDTPIQLSLP